MTQTRTLGTERRSDYHYGYDAGYADARDGQYEPPIGTPEFNRGYNEGAGHRFDLEDASD